MILVISWLLFFCFLFLWVSEYIDGRFLEFALKQQSKGYVVNLLDMSKLGKTKTEIEASSIESDALIMGFKTRWRKIGNFMIIVWTD